MRNWWNRLHPETQENLLAGGLFLALVALLAVVVFNPGGMFSPPG